MEQISFNINDRVYFKLTPKGLAHWEKYFNRFGRFTDYTFEKHFTSYSAPDGWNYLQFHGFMKLFGEVLIVGIGDLFFETTIRFDSQDLHPVKK